MSDPHSNSSIERDFDVVSDTTKVLTAVFTGTLDSADALIAVFEWQIVAHPLPRP